MKFYITFLLIIILFKQSYAQSDIWEVYERREKSSVVENCLNFDSINNKTLIIINEADTNISDFYEAAYLRILDSEGKIIKERKLEIDSLNTFYLLQSYYMVKSNEIVLLGGATTLKGKKGRKYLVHIVLDTSLQEKKMNFIPVDDGFSVFQIECSKSLILDEYLCAVVSITAVQRPAMNYLFSIKGDSLVKFREKYIENFGHLIWNIFQSPFDSSEVAIHYNIIKMNSDFTNQTSLSNIKFIGANSKDVIINNRKILISSGGFFENTPSGSKYGQILAYFNDKYKIEKSNGVGDGLKTLPLWKNQIDLKFPNKIYGIAHNQEFVTFGPFRFFELALFDIELNKQWEIKYGLNTGRLIQPLGITATYDGGVIVYGNTYTQIGQNFHRDPFYIKFDNKGEIVSTVEATSKESISIKTFPNPTSDYFYIECQSDEKLTIEIYNNAGVKLDRHIIADHKINIDVRHYSSNMYHYKIINKNGEEYTSGSFVKN
ncbi:MAG: Secretion system C-terminal sorting domain [Bacteroidota bacterium]